MTPQDKMKILVVSLTNIGDVLLTLPVIDVLMRDYPMAAISVVVGPRGEGLLRGNPVLDRVFVYDKTRSFPDVLEWFGDLRCRRFDLVVDLRNTAMPFFLRARKRTSPFLKRIKGQHMLDQHLKRLATVHAFTERQAPARSLFFSAQDIALVDGWVRDFKWEDGFCAVSPGAAGGHKRWTAEGYARVCDYLIAERQCPAVLIGDDRDRECAAQVKALMKNPCRDLCGQTTLQQAAALIGRSRLVVTNDSAPLHMASYLDVPVLALFGPTDPRQYGPWGRNGKFIQAKGPCPACAGEKESAHRCMANISPEEVCAVLDGMLEPAREEKG